MKKQEKRILLVCFSLMTFNVYAVDLSKSIHNSWNWFEAQQHCSNANDTLRINYVSLNAVQHWTGVYRRYSPWIKLLGCYDSKDVDEHRTHNFNINFTSAGFCQEICASVNSTVFGIQPEECVCLKRPFLADTLLSDQCSNKCNDVEEGAGIKFLECGGLNAYTLYISEDDNEKRSRETACLAIDCGSVKNFSISTDCSESYFGVCAYKEYLGCFKDQPNRTLKGNVNNSWYMTTESCKTFCRDTQFYGVEYSGECFCGNFLSTNIIRPEGECNMKCHGNQSQTCGGDFRINIYSNPNYKTGTKTNWTASMQRCENGSPPSYLTGNVSLSNAASACEQLHLTRSGLSWLGIAKEVYIGYDRGVAVDIYDRATFLQCQKCNQTGCEFIDCFQKLKYSFCEKELEIETIQRRASYSNTDYLIIPLSLSVLVLAGCLVMGVVCYKCKKANQKNETAQKVPNLHENYYVNNTLAQSKFHSAQIFESERFSRSANNKNDFDDTYQESLEGVYDHMRNNDTRKRKTENVYDHAPVVTEQEYAYGGYNVNIAVNEQHLESTYDHAASISDYGQHFRVVNNIDDNYY